MEFTLTIPGALDLVEEFSRRKDLVVGAGTVLTAQEARLAVRRGAQFLVFPVMDPEAIDAWRQPIYALPASIASRLLNARARCQPSGPDHASGVPRGRPGRN